MPAVPQNAFVKRLIYAYLIGLAACFISFSVANRPHGGHWNTLVAALLGMSATIANAFGQRSMTVPTVFAAAVLSLVFVLAEALRSRSSWLRWAGYALWVLLAVATFWWFAPPNI
jgi:predicted ferric reductase